MSYNRNPNLKLVGFFGQSGAGKTTVIRNIDTTIEGQNIVKNTGIIRNLFWKDKNKYSNPMELIDKNKKELEELKGDDKKAKIDEIYEKYIRSQISLLNDWSTEMYLMTTENYIVRSIALLDRSPIDFYVLTKCGVEVLMKEYKQELNPLCDYLVRLCCDIASDNTNNFFNAIFVTKPWNSSNINILRDGIRDQYLSTEYADNNWYTRFDDVKLNDNVKIYTLGDDVTDLHKRTRIVYDKLMEI